jgi:hypothetical protein
MPFKAMAHFEQLDDARAQMLSGGSDSTNYGQFKKLVPTISNPSQIYPGNYGQYNKDYSSEKGFFKNPSTFYPP